MPKKFEGTIYQNDHINRPDQWRWVLWRGWQAVATGVQGGMARATLSLAVAAREWRMVSLDVDILDDELTFRERWHFAGSEEPGVHWPVRRQREGD